MKRIALLVGAMALAGLSLSAAEQTWEGEISDSACALEHESGAENVPPPPAPQCVANCIKGGSKYVFVAGDKVMQIANQDFAALPKLAGTKVKVTGEAKGDSVTITKMEKAE